MKIISKYKDFYDYLAQDYDADIVYSRIPRWTGDLRLRKFYMGSSSWWKYSEPNKLLYIDPEIRWCSAKVGDIMISGIVFGIYPFIYSTPILKVFGQDDGYEDIWRYPTPIYVGKSFVERLEAESNPKVKSKLISEFVQDFIKNHNKNCSIWDKLQEQEYSYYMNNKENILDIIKSYARKIECSEIFKTLGSPVFIEENELIDFFHTPFPEKEKGTKEKQYLVDLSFTVLNSSIIKYWYDDLCNINTYNDIENFLWSIKQEPQSEQTNKEKILSHGFDLKTSFRKM